MMSEKVPNGLRSVRVDVDRAERSLDLAIMAVRQPRHDAMRAKRAALDERRFVAERNREVWQ